MGKVILDLCGGTGAWSLPYSEAGYEVILFDTKDLGRAGDVRFLELDSLPENVHGILAAPPCTHLSGSGARWWKGKGDEALIEALSIVDACIRIVHLKTPVFWALENPVGRLTKFLGKPKMYFNPCDFGDPYTKKTCLWGNFNIPKKSPVLPVEGSKIHLMPPSVERATLRSITPPRFAKAFFEANP